VYWHRGRSPSYGEGITFWALGEMVRRRAGLSEDDDEQTTRERITATVDDYVPEASERAIVEPALLTLLGIGDAASGGRDALFPAWRTFFERISERGTTALIFEDLQWADSGLLDFIDHLLDWSKSRPILVVTLARPELFDKRPDWGAGRRTFTSLALDPLTDDSVRLLLEGVVPGLPPSAVAAIVSRAEGMPLYAVETVRALLAEGKIERDGAVYRPVGDLSSLTVPESLRSLIASRLDALEASDRRLLQDASVLGQVFDVPTLAAVTGESAPALEERLRDLARRELVEVETDPRSPERGQYKFVQALIREVAYGTLALRDRRARHLAIARQYEALGDEELAGGLASHYLAAHELSAEGPEADAVAAQARIALRAAADRAAALGAHSQAVTHLDHALTITTNLAERAELLERAAESSFAGVTGDTERYAREALTARVAVEDASGIYRATALVAQTLLDLGQIEAAIEMLENARAGATGEPDPESEAELLVALSRAYMRDDRGADAIEAADRALSIAEPRNLVRVVADAMNNRAATLNMMGRRREATALLEAAIKLADEGGWVTLAHRLRNNLSVVLSDDEPARAGELAREMVETAQRIGNVQLFLHAAAAAAGSDFLEMHDWDTAMSLAEEALEHGLAGSISWIWIQLVTTVVALRAARGDPIDDAIGQIDAAILPGKQRWWAESARAEAAISGGEEARAVPMLRAVVEAGETDTNEPYLRGQLAYCLLMAGDMDAARAVTDELRGGIFHGALTQAILAAADAGLAAADGRLAEARAGFTGAFNELRRLQQRIDLVRWQVLALRMLPDAPEAAGWAAEATELCEAVGARPYLERLADLRDRASRPTAARHAAERPQAVRDPS
jgi:predicted ATPase